jgi:hypothetical protein
VPHRLEHGERQNAVGLLLVSLFHGVQAEDSSGALDSRLTTWESRRT